MKHTKQILAVLLTLALTLSTLVGCSGKSVQNAEKQKNKTSKEETASQNEPREITDMAGRKVTLPDSIDSVFSSGPAAAIYLYTLVPDLLLGWNYDLNEIEKSVILEKYHTLPNFGMGDSVNYEAVIAAGPDIALNVGTINDAMISDCDSLSEQLGIPVIAVDGDLKAAPDAYRFMGKLFDVSDQAEKLAAYAEKTFNDIDAMEIPEDKKVRLYYGNGEDSLETAPKGSGHAQLIDLVKAENVADLELGDGSRVQISAEQLLAWDPDVIAVVGEPKASLSGHSAANAILNNPNLASLKAVQEGKVYGIPNAPFNWVDRPAGPNRIIGIRWLSGLLYPEYLNFDADDAVKEFFSLFYHVDLTEEQLQQLYNGTIGTK